MAGSVAEPQHLATVFTSSSGDPVNCHALCEALAAPGRLMSPTRFTNSVHNATAGYWHIATQSRAASTSLCGFDASFAAGLLEAAVQCVSGGEPVLLVASDIAYPEPLHALRPTSDALGLALLLAPADGSTSTSTAPILTLRTRQATRGDSLSTCGHAGLGPTVPRGASGARLAAVAGLGAHGAGAVAAGGFPGAAPAGEPGCWGAWVMKSQAADALLVHHEIAALIPHAGAMCLLDHVWSWSDDEIVCTATDHRHPDHPLRSRSGLLASCLVEYAAQAMALHGALRQTAAGQLAGPRPGFLASARGVQLKLWRLDEVAGPLRIQAWRQAGTGSQVLYGFCASDAHGASLAEGRAAVVLDTPLPAPTTSASNA